MLNSRVLAQGSSASVLLTFWGRWAALPVLYPLEASGPPSAGVTPENVSRCYISCFLGGTVENHWSHPPTPPPTLQGGFWAGKRGKDCLCFQVLFCVGLNPPSEIFKEFKSGKAPRPGLDPGRPLCAQVKGSREGCPPAPPSRGAFHGEPLFRPPGVWLLARESDLPSHPLHTRIHHSGAGPSVCTEWTFI